MIGTKRYLKEYQIVNEGYVTFRDRVKEKVIGIGTLNVDGFPRLNNVLHVEWLQTNLISISQPCDQDLFMQFTKKGCQVVDIENK